MTGRLVWPATPPEQEPLAPKKDKKEKVLLRACLHHVKRFLPFRAKISEEELREKVKQLRSSIRAPWDPEEQPGSAANADVDADASVGTSEVVGGAQVQETLLPVDEDSTGEAEALFHIVMRQERDRRLAAATQRLAARAVQ